MFEQTVQLIWQSHIKSLKLWPLCLCSQFMFHGVESESWSGGMKSQNMVMGWKLTIDEWNRLKCVPGHGILKWEGSEMPRSCIMQFGVLQVIALIYMCKFITDMRKYEKIQIWEKHMRKYLMAERSCLMNLLMWCILIF